MKTNTGKIIDGKIMKEFVFMILPSMILSASHMPKLTHHAD